MERRSLRSIPRKCYSEFEEPNLDEYVFCEKCADFVYEYCSIHGPLLVVPDDKVPSKTGYPSFVPRAALTIPRVFIHLAPSIIPGAGLGVFSTLTLPCGVRFGPYRGRQTKDIESTYCWQIRDSNNKRSHVIDASDANTSNWMRYVNCARHWNEQNLVAYQYQGHIYYRTIKIIPRYTELLVFYGSEFAVSLHVDLRTYNSPAGYAQKFGAPAPKKLIRGEKIKSSEKPEGKLSAKEKNIGDKLSTNIELKTGIHNEKVKNGEENKQAVNKTKKRQCKKNNDKTNKNKILKKKQTNPSLNSKKTCNLKKDDRVSLICERCGLIYKCKKTLGFHLKTHQSKIVEENNVEDKKKSETNTSALNNLKTTQTDDKPYKCNYCNKSFTQKASLKLHINLHTDDKPYKCDYCNKSFARKDILKRHINLHTDDKPYKCDYCNKSFARKDHLKVHIRSHTGDKPYKCDYCRRPFSDKRNLYKHVKTHTGEKPYVCNYCGRSFTLNNNKKRHIRMHKDEKV